MLLSDASVWSWWECFCLREKTLINIFAIHNKLSTWLDHIADGKIWKKNTAILVVSTLKLKNYASGLVFHSGFDYNTSFIIRKSKDENTNHYSQKTFSDFRNRTALTWWQLWPDVSKNTCADWIGKVERKKKQKKTPQKETYQQRREWMWSHQFRQD